jgi:hypothetical protein
MVLTQKNGQPVASPKWDAAAAAAKAFFEAPESRGISASLHFFPVGFSDGSVSCAASDYESPEVLMSMLPSVDFATQLRQHQPDGVTDLATPTFAALSGAIAYAQSISSNEGKDGTVAMVLVTDGLPDSKCLVTDPATTQGFEATKVELAKVEELASSVKAAIPTYVIGVGSQLESLESLATAGGTKKPFIVHTDDAAQIQRELLSSINSIRSLLACDYEIPPAPAGEKLDRDLVNVIYTAAGKPNTVGQSPACENGEGWRYDNPDDPKRIVLCDATCNTVRAKGSQVNVLFGCATKFNAVK